MLYRLRRLVFLYLPSSMVEQIASGMRNPSSSSRTSAIRPRTCPEPEFGCRWNSQLDPQSQCRFHAACANHRRRTNHPGPSGLQRSPHALLSEDHRCEASFEPHCPWARGLRSVFGYTPVRFRLVLKPTSSRHDEQSGRFRTSPLPRLVSGPAHPTGGVPGPLRAIGRPANARRSAWGTRSRSASQRVIETDLGCACGRQQRWARLKGRVAWNGQRHSVQSSPTHPRSAGT
jgi:hypothetical protein